MPATRLAQLRRAAAAADLAGVAVIPGPNLFQLTGLLFHLSERPVVLFVPVKGEPVLVVPTLEEGKARRLPYSACLLTYDDVTGPAQAFAMANEALGLGDGRLGVESRRCRFLELELFGEAQPVGADALFAALRMRKSPEELDLMRRAAAIAETALTATLPSLHAGITERQVAAELMQQLYRAGSDPSLPFTPLVASGPNGADPHLFPTDRPLGDGELVVIDWGASHHGFMSDITRTFRLGDPPAVLREVYAVVRAAARTGRAAVQPGVTAESVDQATRQVIVDAGYGERFIHRTGHGLGLEGHEEPDIKEGDTTVLEPGMTFTIEPGVYLPGVGGVRIEDDMVVTASGGESLTTLPRRLQSVG